MIKTKPVYKNLYSKKSQTEVWKRAREQQRRDAFAWKVGLFAMTVISMVGSLAVYWALTL